MNYRQKSKIYGKWAFVKYRGNGAYYAVCQHCGFTYPCYEINGLICKPDKVKLHSYKYCPWCGLKMSEFDTENYYLHDDLGKFIERKKI